VKKSSILRSVLKLQSGITATSSKEPEEVYPDLSYSERTVCSRLSRHKGHDTLFRAFNILGLSMHKIILVVTCHKLRYELED